MSRRLFLGSAASAALLLTGTRARSDAPLQLGIVPHVSPRVLLTNYQPLRSHLEKQLGRAVEIGTAAGFREFHARSVAGTYDLVLTAANLGRVAELDGRLNARAIMEPPIPGLLVMLKEKQVESIEALRGRTLALANPASLVALKGMAWMRAQNLVVGSDFRTAHAANEDSLGQLLNSGEAPLALMSAGEFRAVPEALRERLAVFTEFTRVPGFMFMSRPDLAAGEVARLDAALTGFMASDEGVAFARLTGNRAVRAIRAEDLASLADVIDDTRRLLA